MRKSVVALNLGLNWNEQRERTKNRYFVLRLRARRRDVVLNRRIVVGRLSRVMALLEPGSRMAVDPLLGMPRRDICERLRGRQHAARDRAVRADVRLANRRRLCHHREKETWRQQSQHHGYFPSQR